MITINCNTKIAELIKQHPQALEAIVGISPKFTKLRNPILRKVIAGRTSIAMASKISGVSVNDFFTKLQSLGFTIDKNAIELPGDIKNAGMPAFMKNISADKIAELDVRPVIETGKDPLNIILQKIKELQQGDVLKIVNTFQPTPLMHLLGKQGFQSFAEVVNEELVNTYFYKTGDHQHSTGKKEQDDATGWDKILDRYKDKLVSIDVRHLEMPLPMHTILEALQTLPENKALLVHHKRIPVFLLPELEAQQFNYRINEISGEVVELLIYKD